GVRGGPTSGGGGRPHRTRPTVLSACLRRGGRCLLPPGRHDRVEQLMPGRRLRIQHRTGYRYASPVVSSFNEVRMTPLDDDGQVLIAHELRVEPRAAVLVYTDYWGARVESFDTHEPHDVLEVIA